MEEAAPAGQDLTTGSQCGLYFHRDLLRLPTELGRAGPCELLQKCLPAPERGSETAGRSPVLA